MTDRTAHAFWTVDVGKGAIRRHALAPPAAGECLVRALYSGISRGSETLVFDGRVPPSQYTAMRAPFQEGAFPAPVKYGYASVGAVEQGPADLRGATVFCLYPHQDLYIVPAPAVLPLPPGVPAERAVLAANMETALNALWDAEPLAAGTPLTVIGAGVVGCLVARLAARRYACDVELVDIDSGKAAVAEALGVRFAAPGDAQGERPVVIHASGAPQGLVAALELAAFEATVLELSWYGDRPVPLPLGEAFHARRLTLRSSQVGSVAPSRRARVTPTDRLAEALSALADPALDVLISGESRFEDLPALMPRLSGGPPGTLCHRIAYRP